MEPGLSPLSVLSVCCLQTFQLVALDWTNLVLILIVYIHHLAINPKFFHDFYSSFALIEISPYLSCLDYQILSFMKEGTFLGNAFIPLSTHAWCHPSH